MREHRDEAVGRAVMDFATPPASEGFFANVLEAIGEGRRQAKADSRSARIPLPRLDRVRQGGWRPMVLAGAVVVLSLVVGAIAGAILAKPGKGATPTLVTSFQPAPGWNTVETNLRSDPTAPQVAWAANVPFKPESFSGLPDNTIKNLPPGGIVIVVEGPWVYTGDEPLPELSLPPKLSDFYFVSDNYEGQPAPNVSFYNISAHVSEKEIVDIQVSMGTTQPTESMINAANEELARLSLPS